MSDSSSLEIEALNLKKEVEQLRVELEMAQRFHDLAVAERNYERTQTHILKLRLEQCIRAWEDEKQTRNATGQPAQAALILSFLKDLKALGG